MAYYSTCPYCGCNLDPGEKCDCGQRRQENLSRKQEFFRKHLRTESETGQMRFAFDERSEAVCK